LFNANLTIFSYNHSKDKLHFNEMMRMVSALY